MSLEAAWVGAEKYKFENGEQEVILPNATFFYLCLSLDVWVYIKQAMSIKHKNLQIKQSAVELLCG